MENLDSIGEALAELTAKYSGYVQDKRNNGSMDVHKSAADAQDAASNHTTTSTTRYPNIMILDIGGRIFKVSRITLLESGLFRHQMSNRFTWEPEADGSYFLDADPDLFEHLLRFMRRPNIFPLFYTTCTGFDYDLYNRLENEAEYFQIEALHTWLMEKRYLRAVMLHRYQPQTRTLDDLSPEKAPISETEDMHMLPRVKQVYICPRGIGVHRGEPDKCGRACHEAQGDNDDEFEEVLYTEVVSVRKEVEFIGSVCRLE